MPTSHLTALLCCLRDCASIRALPPNQETPPTERTVEIRLNRCPQATYVSRYVMTLEKL